MAPAGTAEIASSPIFCFSICTTLSLASDSGDIARILSDMSMANIESEDSSKKPDLVSSSSFHLSAPCCVSSGNIAIIICSPEI